MMDGVPNIYTDRGISEKEYHRCQAEHIRQQQKWGIQERTAFEWLSYIMEEIGELSEAIQEYEYHNGPKEDVIKEASHAATLLLKIMRMFDVKEFGKVRS
jgi:NTP pyrophosphatase (non-canonical NTP hydrolase)